MQYIDTFAKRSAVKPEPMICLARRGCQEQDVRPSLSAGPECNHKYSLASPVGCETRRGRGCYNPANGYRVVYFTTGDLP